MITTTIKRGLAALALAFFQLMAFAQETKSEVKIVKEVEVGEWYKQPYVWIIAGALFILILVAILRNNGKRSV